jgi:LEA14-like dessication related protein
MGMIRTTIWLIALCTLQACGVRAPITQFNSANVTNSTPEAISITAHFDVSNTNDEPLRLEKYKYYVTVDGRTVYQGLAAAELTVPSLRSISSSIPIVIRREEIGD